MQTFKIEIDMENAAFDEAPATEIGRLLRLVAESVEDGGFDGSLLDLNGNTVGRFAFTEGR